MLHQELLEPGQVRLLMLQHLLNKGSAGAPAQDRQLTCAANNFIILCIVDFWYWTLPLDGLPHYERVKL